jgi:hypothetical protein
MRLIVHSRWLLRMVSGLTQTEGENIRWRGVLPNHTTNRSVTSILVPDLVLASNGFDSYFRGFAFSSYDKIILCYLNGIP